MDKSIRRNNKEKKNYKKNIIPKNIAKIIDIIQYKKKEIGIPPIKLEKIYIKSIKKSKYFLAGDYNCKEYEEIINLKSVNLSNNLALSKDSIYIGIDKKCLKNKLELFVVNYYGKYIENIVQNGKNLIKFENGLVDKDIMSLYKLIFDVYKKYGINKNNLNIENIKKNNGKSYNFLFKKVHKINNIPEDLIIDIGRKMRNNKENYSVVSLYVSEYVNSLAKDIKLLRIEIYNLIFFNILNDIKLPIHLIKIKKYIINNNYNINNQNLYFAYIIYNFSDNEIFDKIIYLGKFIKKEGNFLYFENIIINPRSEKLKEFDLYYAVK